MAKFLSHQSGLLVHSLPQSTTPASQAATTTPGNDTAQEDVRKKMMYRGRESERDRASEQASKRSCEREVCERELALAVQHAKDGHPHPLSGLPSASSSQIGVLYMNTPTAPPPHCWAVFDRPSGNIVGANIASPIPINSCSIFKAKVRSRLRRLSLALPITIRSRSVAVQWHRGLCSTAPVPCLGAQLAQSGMDLSLICTAHSCCCLRCALQYPSIRIQSRALV